MSLLDSIKNTAHGAYKKFVEDNIISDNQLKNSKFNKKGILTPDEFIQAGCQLVYKCPTWQWEAGDKKKKKNYFPDNQQYLITRNVPCLKRVSALNINNKATETVVENGEWLAFEDNNNDTNNNNNNNNENKNDDDIDDIDDIDDVVDDNLTNNNNENKADNDNNNDNNINNNSTNNNDANVINNDDDGDSFSESYEIPDIETFNDDDNIVTTADKKKDLITNNIESKDNNINDDDTIVKTRTYDISITYDKYYRVPRVWLRGYDENKNPLTSKEIFEDISADHAHKTVTVEEHPHISNTICASIHPCRHGEVMKVFMDKMESNGSKFTVDQYMFLFLKFMNAVIPTIEYDFTIQASTK